jgi:hypothetical protein
LYVVEFSIPFGKEIDEITGNSLKQANHKKRAKYSYMIEHLRKQFEDIPNYKFRYEINFKTIIVSSLGAVPGFTIHNFVNIVGDLCRKDVLLWMKRVVMAALK